MVLAAVAVVMAACSSDDTDAKAPEPTNETDLLLLRITTNANVTTRERAIDWTDANAQDEEMMNLWVVMVTNTSDGSMVKCLACRPSAGEEQEIDEVGQLSKGAYTVYSFANISFANVCTLLGLTAPNSIPTINNTPVEIAMTGTVNHTNALAATATVNGNNFDPTAADNGFGEKGIPMSNVQTIGTTETTKDLIVVRMLAKIEIQLYNETGHEVTVTSVTLSDITNNGSDNLKLMPLYTTASNANTMEAVHGDLQPNLSDTKTTSDYIYEVPTVQQSVAIATYDSGNPAQIFTFYINESATPSNGEGLFYLTLKMSDTEYRYALISSQSTDATAANYKWNYIARNDYRIIPIVLDDYKLELIPYDFPPIGVYPASVREIENDLYEMTFHDYGHFHLVPKVTKMSDNLTVPYSATEPSATTWTLRSATADPAKTAWENSFFTAATKGGEWANNGNPNISAPGIVTDDYFYRNQVGTVDGDDVGGVPIWYANTSSPQWDPAGGSTYNPFIFGYIAEPPADWWTTPIASRPDRQVYHEFRVKLFVGGTYRRDLLYRFYMTLSADQMLGARTTSGARGDYGRRTHSYQQSR